MPPFPPEVYAFVGALLTAILARRRDITLLAAGTKRNKRIRGLVLEFIIYVPASVALILLLARPVGSWDVVGRFVREHPMNETAFYAALGIVAYQFPFAALRRLLIGAALEFVNQILIRVQSQLKAAEKR